MDRSAILPSRPRSWRGEFGATLRLSWPLALANLLQMLTYAIDVIFIARLGEEPLAASALSVSYFGLIFWALSGLTGAVAPMISAELGRRAPALRPVRRTTRMALWLAVLSGALGMALCMTAGPFMRLTGQEPRITALGSEYMAILVWSLIPMLLANVLRNFVSALDRALFATLITAGGIFVNAFANYALIFGNFGMPALGLVGAGLATLITSVLTVLAYVAVIALDRRLARYRILGKWWRPDRDRLVDLIRIGTPIGLTIVAEGGIFSAAAFMMGRFGALELAAHTVALQIAALAFQVPFGIGQAATIRVGYYYGARDPVGMARAGWSAIVVGTLFMACTALAMLIVPKALISIYVDVDAPENATLLVFALRYLTVAAAFQLFDGLQAVAAGALRGLQDTRVPMWIAVFSYWVPGFGIAMGLGFGAELAGIGIWLGLATGLVVAAFLLVRRWTRRDRLGLTGRPAGEPAPLVAY
ncbi:multidrug resistance protein NorM [Novosphingobium marinum]|uniref:Multidrug-efflux transporter n=1 Tax=Novosphingobium marinum TaxID=1514948 RepID=A0A7Y9Y087_9SPHN|nr:MATE family efflux transporter [Novosphingobium marinum]NYH96256.1 MATE family multidrug resistance protein [Novosphingobium marinum]GGC33722.1 multidrug resistance protein NorM [Novosphingobium marinum]